MTSTGRVFESLNSGRLREIDFTGTGVDPDDIDLTAVDVYYDGTNAHVRIVGAGGYVLFRDPAGWSEPKSETSERLTAVTFQSATQGHVIGQQYVVCEYN